MEYKGVVPCSVDIIFDQVKNVEEYNIEVTLNYIQITGPPAGVQLGLATTIWTHKSWCTH